jgi:hypothetical protein
MIASVWDARPFVHAAAALILVGPGVLLSLKGRRRRRDNVFSLLGSDPPAAKSRASFLPVDLTRPIQGEAAWRGVAAASSDAAYRRAVETARNRYAVVSNPMLLPNTLRTAMERRELDFREAMIRVAEDDDLR